ncbi:hypothetical protein Taro_023612 [Colocasia esculenta]|uniref:Zinc finger PHD-type domain-containing protein n=1 Tax=Colocasia esculenta TaxID=4460 RepID=A0A843VF11_COLES|nr:hypothetical protein [Colocasia esculenta]
MCQYSFTYSTELTVSLSNCNKRSAARPGEQGAAQWDSASSGAWANHLSGRPGINSEPFDTGTSHHYYNRDDLNNVIELLKASYTSYAAIISSISAYWRIPAWYPGSGSHIDWEGHGKYLNVAHRFASEMAEGENMVEKEQHTNSSSFCENPQHSTGASVEPCKFEFETANTSHLSGLTRPDAFSECSAASEEAHDCTNFPTLPRTEATYMTGSPSNGDIDLSSKCSQIMQEKQNEPRSSDHILLASEKTNDAVHVHLNNGGYVNCYSFGHIASLLAEELTSKSSGNITKDNNMSAEDIISGQLRAIYKKSMNRYWSAIQKLPVNAQKESCGWCFVCKSPSEQECLLRIIETKVLVGPRNRTVGLHSKDNRKNHILSVVHHVLQIEDGSHGLLSGPWQNPHHKKQWRKQVFKSADVASLKYLLLTLEYHLRRIALSAEWLKPVDSNLTVGSASYFMTSERGVGRKHARKNVSETKRMSDSAVSSLSNCASATTIYWWRGGKLSRQVFHWKMLPRSLASKGARQAGCRKIPGVFYPEGSEFAKRSKHVAWRAVVEMSQNVAQLAYQVKDLDSHIRWNEIGPPLSQLVKDPRKPLKPSWKATICEKCVEGAHVNYLIDFGKRKIIPDAVTKHGVLHEESSESKKYWLDESHVPVNLLKSFEVRNLEQMLKKTSFEVASSVWNRHKMANPRRQRGLSLLLSRGEKPDQNLCVYCLVRKLEIAFSQFCCYSVERTMYLHSLYACNSGLIHKKHFRVPKGAIATTYRCYACKDKKFTYESKETKVLDECKEKGSPNESKDKKPVDGPKGKKFPNGNEDKKVVDGHKSKKSAVGRKDRKGTNKDAKLLCEGKDKKLVDECEGKKISNRCKGKKIVGAYQRNKSEEGFKDKKIVNEINKKRLARSRKRKTKLGKSNVLVLRKSERLAKKKQHMKKGKKRNIGHKKAKQSHKRKDKQVTPEKNNGGISWRRGQRTGICPPYWLNGLLWTRKAYDERAVHFRETRVLLPFPNSKDSLQPVCSLCHKEYDSQVIYIACENCGDWFHGDVFSLTLVNINNIRGFKCHRCRTQSTPVCPYLGDDVDEANLPEENNLVVDHLDDNPGLQCLVYDSQDLLHEHDCSGIDHSQNLDEDQQAVPIPDSGKILILKQSIETTAEIVPTDTDAHPLTEAQAAEHSCVKFDEVKVVDEDHPS